MRTRQLVETIFALFLGWQSFIQAQTITEFPIPTLLAGSLRITTGPDGNLWFTERGTRKIGRITPAGVIVEFPIPTTNSAPFGIAAGRDGALWFTKPNLGALDHNGNHSNQKTDHEVVLDFQARKPLSVNQRKPRAEAPGRVGHVSIGSG